MARAPKLLQELIVTAGQIAAKPEWKWMRTRDVSGRPAWEMEKGKRKLDEKGNPIPKMMRIKTQSGTDGLLGYLVNIAKDEPQLYASLLRGVLPHNVKVSGDLAGGQDGEESGRLGTVVDLRQELERRGVPVDHLARELLASTKSKTKRPRPRLIDRDEHELDQPVDDDQPLPDGDDDSDEGRYR